MQRGRLDYSDRNRSASKRLGNDSLERNNSSNYGNSLIVDQKETNPKNLKYHHESTQWKSVIEAHNELEEVTDVIFTYFSYFHTS